MCDGGDWQLSVMGAWHIEAMIILNTREGLRGPVAYLAPNFHVFLLAAMSPACTYSAPRSSKFIDVRMRFPLRYKI